MDIPLFSHALRNNMKQIITTPEQLQALRQTQLAYRDALNAVSHYAFEHGKTSNTVVLHRGMYAELRARYHLPSQLACSVERQVAATYKGLWTKLKKNTEHRRRKMTKKRFKGLDQAPRYSSPTVQYTYERDYTFQRNQRVSIGTLNGRSSIPYQGYNEHTTLVGHGARIGDARLWYDKAKKTFYLLVSLEIEVPELTCERLTEAVGVDVGIRYLAVTSTPTGRASFHPGKHVRHTANHKARKANRVYSQWSFAQLHALISYKAVLSGSQAIKVDADYTSKRCPICGYTADENRPRKGLLFVCQQCHYTLHADLIGARNLVIRTLVLRQDWSTTGHLSLAPDTSDKEAKAARLQRYAELRWSPDASLCLQAEGS